MNLHIAILVVLLNSLFTCINSQPGNLDFLVALLQNHRCLCSGSLLSMNLVITAAKCVNRKKTDLNLIDVMPDPEHFCGQYRKVNDVFYDKDENGRDRKGDMDIALFNLNIRFSEEDGVGPIPLYKYQLTVGDNMIVRKFGYTRNPTSYRVDLAIVEPPHCRDHSGQRNMYCAKGDIYATYPGVPGIAHGQLCAVGIDTDILDYEHSKLFADISDPDFQCFITDLIANNN